MVLRLVSFLICVVSCCMGLACGLLAMAIAWIFWRPWGSPSLLLCGHTERDRAGGVLCGGGGGGKIANRGAPGGGLLMVPCSGFYVNLKSVFPLIRFEKGVFGELIHRFR